MKWRQCVIMIYLCFWAHRTHEIVFFCVTQAVFISIKTSKWTGIDHGNWRAVSYKLIALTSWSRYRQQQQQQCLTYIQLVDACPRQLSDQRRLMSSERKAAHTYRHARTHTQAESKIESDRATLLQSQASLKGRLSEDVKLVIFTMIRR